MGNEVTADHSEKQRLARRLKRRRIFSNEQNPQGFCGEPAKKNDQRREVCDADEDYWDFICNFSKSMDETHEDLGSELVDNEHHDDRNFVSECEGSYEDVDPDHMAFLRHLVEDGRSYKLKIYIGRELKAFKYEEEEKLSDGSQINLKTNQKRQYSGPTRILRSAAVKKEKMENPEKIGPVIHNKKNSLGDLNAPSRAIGGKMENSEEMGPVIHNKKNSLGDLNAPSRVIGEKPLRGNPAKKSRLRVPKQELSEDCADPISCTLNGKSNKMNGTGFVGSVERPCKSDSDSGSMEEDYRKFLVDYYKPGDGWPEDSETTYDSEMVVMDIAPCRPKCASSARKSVHTTIDVDSGKFLRSPGTCNRSGFRERLMQYLKKPYDKNEYKNFLAEARRRRAHVRDREFRNGSAKQYPLNSVGKSYLEIHGDLARKIELVRCDRPKTLNLLRGLFYWLQNLSHEGAFQPWNDPSCLNVLPKQEF